MYMCIHTVYTYLFWAVTNTYINRCIEPYNSMIGMYTLYTIYMPFTWFNLYSIIYCNSIAYNKQQHIIQHIQHWSAYCIHLCAYQATQSGYYAHSFYCCIIRLCRLAIFETKNLIDIACIA